MADTNKNNSFDDRGAAAYRMRGITSALAPGAFPWFADKAFRGVCLLRQLAYNASGKEGGVGPAGLRPEGGALHVGGMRAFCG